MASAGMGMRSWYFRKASYSSLATLISIFSAWSPSSSSRFLSWFDRSRPSSLSFRTILLMFSISSRPIAKSSLVAPAGNSPKVSASKYGSLQLSSYFSSSRRSSSACLMSALILCTSTCSGASSVTRCTRVQISFLYIFSSAIASSCCRKIMLSCDTSFGKLLLMMLASSSSSSLLLEMVSSIVITIMLIAFSLPTNDITAVVMIASAAFSLAAIGILFGDFSK